MSTARPARRIRSSLFVRIYATFVVTVLVFAAMFGFVVWLAASTWSEGRVSELVDAVEARGDEMLESLRARDHDTLVEIDRELEAELEAEVHLVPHEHGRRFGPPVGAPELEGKRRHRRLPPGLHDHPPSRTEIRRLRHGHHVVRRRGLAPPVVAVPILDPEEPPREGRRSRIALLVVIEPRHNPARNVALAGILLLVALGGGTWPLARSLTSRLAKLEASTDALARGELSHRATVAGAGAGKADGEPRDEIDRLARSFNQMADRLELLVNGQRTLLANVSHELRTPIARIKVLVEILGDRLEMLREADERGAPLDRESIDRLERGLGEMQEDLGEVEALIQDLLTSGRLELGSESALLRETIVLAELCEGAAARFDARVECEPGVELEGDPMLLDRLLRNLLANARRACPEGEILVRGRRVHGATVIEVEDTGPGIPADKRKEIFEPFARLDAARARDRGGVGLGLYLCRQIAAAHGGTIEVLERRDGRSGARFVLKL